MQRCHTAWPISGSPSLDGVYTLLEERPLIDMTPQDREICQVSRIEMRKPFFGDIFLNPKSGCVYARSGSPGKEEYCFAGTSCPSLSFSSSLLLISFQQDCETDSLFCRKPNCCSLLQVIYFEALTIFTENFSAFGEAESLMLERKELVEEIDSLNRLRIDSIAVSLFMNPNYSETSKLV